MSPVIHPGVDMAPSSPVVPLPHTVSQSQVFVPALSILMKAVTVDESGTGMLTPSEGMVNVWAMSAAGTLFTV